MNEQLLTSLYNACEFFRITAVYEEIIQIYTRDQLDCAMKYQRLTERKKSPLLANILSILLGSFSLIMMIATEHIVFLPIGLLLTVVFPLSYCAYCKSATQKYQQEADAFWRREGSSIYAENEKNIEKAQQELEQFQRENFHILEILPQKYRKDTAALWITAAISDRRTDNIQDAIRLYEEQWSKKQPAEQRMHQNNQLRDRLQEVYSQLDASDRLLRNIETLACYNAYIKDQAQS